MMEILKKLSLLITCFFIGISMTTSVINALQPCASEEYTITVNGQSKSYRGSTAQQVMNVTINDSIGIVSSNASLKRNVAGGGWAVLEDKNIKTLNSNYNHVEWIAYVTFYHPVFADYSCNLSAVYNY